MMDYSDIRRLHASAKRFALGAAALTRIERNLLPEIDPTMGGFTEMESVKNEERDDGEHTGVVLRNARGRKLTYDLLPSGGLRITPCAGGDHVRVHV